GGVASPRHDGVLCMGGSSPPKPCGEGHHRQGVRTGEEDRGRGPLAAGQGGRIARRHAGGGSALRLYQVRQVAARRRGRPVRGKRKWATPGSTADPWRCTPHSPKRRDCSKRVSRRWWRGWAPAWHG